MEIQRSLLLIADIGGYTQFIKHPRISLIHAHDVIISLLESIIESARHWLKLAKLEGDAVFMYAPCPTGQDACLAEAPSQIAAMRRAFLQRQQAICAGTMCTCDGCTQVSNLTVKFVAHVGDAGFQKVHRSLELAGLDVILVHRMLKNSVPISEYLLGTSPIYAALKEDVRQRARQLNHDFDGIGETETFFLDLNEIEPAPPAVPRRVWPLRVFGALARDARTLPQLLGLSRPPTNLRNLPVSG